MVEYITHANEQQRLLLDYNYLAVSWPINDYVQQVDLFKYLELENGEPRFVDSGRYQDFSEFRTNCMGPDLEMTVHSDGGVNWSTNPKRNMHACSPEDLESVSKILIEAYSWAFSLIPK